MLMSYFCSFLLKMTYVYYRLTSKGVESNMTSFQEWLLVRSKGYKDMLKEVKRNKEYEKKVSEEAKNKVLVSNNSFIGKKFWCKLKSNGKVYPVLGIDFDIVSYDVSNYLSRLSSNAVSWSCRFNDYIGQSTSEVDFIDVPLHKIV